jgi:uncharacterized protein YhfF
MSDAVKDFWHAFVQSGAYPPGVNGQDVPPAGWFGDNPALADELGQLVYDGVKTATCGALWEWEYDGDPLPEVGQLEIVLDGQNRPICVMEITEVEIKPYNEVDADFAYEEGEDDRTLASWRAAHWSYFSRVLGRVGRTPEETMPLICQRFRVIYRA